MAITYDKDGAYIEVAEDGVVYRRAIKWEDCVVSVPAVGTEKIDTVYVNDSDQLVLVLEDESEIIVTGVTDHGSLTGVTASQHHTKYTNAEAKAAAVLAGTITDGETKAPTHDAVYDIKLVADAAQTAAEVDADIATHAGLADPHTVYIKHSLAAAISDFLVASGVGVFIKKTLAEVKTILGITNVEDTAHSTDAHTMTIDGIDVSAHDIATTGVHGAGGSTLLNTGNDVTVQVSAATDSLAGKSELALAAEVNTGTDTGRTITPDALAGSIFGEKIIYIKVLASDTALTTGDGKAYITIPDALNGMNLVDADIAVYTTSSSGNPTVQLNNLDYSGGAQDMLSTLMTIDAGGTELSSYTAATPPVINGSYDDVATGDRIRIDVDTAGTGTVGLDVILTFQLP